MQGLSGRSQIQAPQVGGIPQPLTSQTPASGASLATTNRASRRSNQRQFKPGRETPDRNQMLGGHTHPVRAGDERVSWLTSVSTSTATDDHGHSPDVTQG
jgi:hypothetical protein